MMETKECSADGHCVRKSVLCVFKNVSKHFDTFRQMSFNYMHCVLLRVTRIVAEAMVFISAIYAKLVSRKISQRN